MKDAAFQSARTFLDLFEGLLNVPDKEYDASRDQAGIFAFREALLHVASRYPHRIAKPKENTREELTRIVADIVEQFRALVEKSDLSDLLWYGDKPRNEKASQLLFFAVAEAYCRANDIDISPETDSGGGPVDFKFSKGYDGRHLVEVKLSTGKVVHGYKTQLLVYREAAGYCEATFLVINVGKMGAKLRTVLRIEQSQENAGEYAPALVVVDATRKPSASKR